jgi:hypothetical protein
MQLRSLIGPVWQEISSLWSGVDFPVYDRLQDSSEHSEQELSPHITQRDANADGSAGHLERCW